MAGVVRLGCAFLVATGLGCNAIAGINEPIDPPATGASRFVGIWRTTAGMQEISGCALADSTTTGQAEFAVRLGTTSDLEVLFAAATNCLFLFDVTGDTATLRPGQTCTIQTSNTSTEAYSYTSMTFALGSDSQGELSFVGSIDFQPQGVVCDFTERSVYNKR